MELINGWEVNTPKPIIKDGWEVSAPTTTPVIKDGWEVSPPKPETISVGKYNPLRILPQYEYKPTVPATITKNMPATLRRPIGELISPETDIYKQFPQLAKPVKIPSLIPELRPATPEEQLAPEVKIPNKADKLIVGSKKAYYFEKTLENITRFAPSVVIAAEYPLMTLGFAGLQEAKNFVVSKVKEEKFNPFETRLITELLPDRTPTILKYASSVGEMVGDMFLMGALSTLAKRNLLKKSISEIGAKLKAAGYGSDKIVIPEEAINNAVKGTSLETEVKRLYKAKNLKPTDKLKTQFAEIKPMLEEGGITTKPAIVPEIKPTIAPIPEKTLKEIRIVEGKEIPVYETKPIIPEVPKITEPAKTITPTIPKTQYKAIVEQQGARYEGIFKGSKELGVSNLVSFTDKQTGSTLALTPEEFTPENVKNKIELSRQAFEKAKQVKTTNQPQEEMITLYHASPNLPKGGNWKKGTNFATTEQEARYYAESHHRDNIDIQKVTIPKSLVEKNKTNNIHILKEEYPVMLGGKISTTPTTTPQIEPVKQLPTEQANIPKTLEIVKEQHVLMHTTSKQAKENILTSGFNLKQFGETSKEWGKNYKKDPIGISFTETKQAIPEEQIDWKGKGNTAIVYSTPNFKKPLIIQDYENGKSWKDILHEKYKTNDSGKILTNKLIKDGYDSIITRGSDGEMREVIALKPEAVKNFSTFQEAQKSYPDLQKEVEPTGYPPISIKEAKAGVNRTEQDPKTVITSIINTQGNMNAEKLWTILRNQNNINLKIQDIVKYGKELKQEGRIKNIIKSKREMGKKEELPYILQQTLEHGGVRPNKKIGESRPEWEEYNTTFPMAYRGNLPLDEMASELGMSEQEYIEAFKGALRSQKSKAFEESVVKPEKIKPFLTVSKDQTVTNTKGNEIILKANEPYRVIDLGKGKILLQDGKRVKIFEGELKNINGTFTNRPNIAAGGIPPKWESLEEIKKDIEKLISKTEMSLEQNKEFEQTAKRITKKEDWRGKADKNDLMKVRDYLTGAIARKGIIEKRNIKYEEKVVNIKTDKEILDSRRSLIRAVQNQFGLSDNDLKSITKRDIRLMNNFEFKKFLDDIRIKAEKLSEQLEAKSQLIAQIEEKELDIEPLRKSMKLPKIANMTTEQLQEFDKILEPYQKGDIFLTQRTLETINRTELEGIRTYREARERLAKKLGMNPEELNKLRISEFDRFKGPSALAEKDPFFRMVVEETAKLRLIRDAEYLEIEESMNKLANKLKTSFIQKLIPQQKNISKWFNTEDKTTVELSKEESDVIKEMQKNLLNAKDYLIKMEAMEKGIASDRYYHHIRRSFLESVKEDGIIKATKEVFERHKLDEVGFNILDTQTGEILANDKFFGAALHRTGKLIPSENIIKSYLDYMKAFKTKQALDEMTPLIMTYANALTPKRVTKTGLLLHGDLIRFMKEWLNTQKGRRITLIAKQGGKIDWGLQGIRTITTWLDIAANIPVSVATQVGELAVTNQLLGKGTFIPFLGLINMAKAQAMSLTPKGNRIIEKYRNFIGKNVWSELVEPAKEIGDRLSAGIFALFGDANTRRNKLFLLGSMTLKEWQTETISPERLAHLKIESGRYAMLSGTKSIIGATPEAGQFTQYKTWALPIFSTTVRNIGNLSTLLTKDKRLGVKSLAEFYRILELVGLIVVIKSFIGDDPKDDTMIGKIKRRAYQESTTLLQAVEPKLFLGVPRTQKFLSDLGSNIATLYRLEIYKSGEKEGDLKGLEMLKKQFTPRGLRQFERKETPATEEIVQEEEIQEEQQE